MELASAPKEPTVKAALRSATDELKAAMAAMESRLVRWMFILWMGQMAALGWLAFEISKWAK